MRLVRKMKRARRSYVGGAGFVRNIAWGAI